MEIEIIDKDKVYVVGKMGEGASDSNSSWIQDLWDDANNNFNEIKDVVKTDSNGNIAGFWGVMTDIDEMFLPWNWQGKICYCCSQEGFEKDDPRLAEIGYSDDDRKCRDMWIGFRGG